MNRYALNKRGFTLIEVLVALVLFALGALALAHMQVLSIKGSTFGKEAMTMTTLAEKKLEELKNTPFDSITTNSTGVVEQGMTITWTVTTVGTSPTRYKTIVLTVSWSGRTTSFATIVSEI